MESTMQADKYYDEVSRFVHAGGHVDYALDQRGSTLLHNVVRLRSTQTVRFLLERGANPNATDTGGITALLIACQSRDVNMAKILLDAGASATMEHDGAVSAICYCCIRQYDELIMLFLDSGQVNVNENVESLECGLLHDQCRRGNLKMVQLLLDKGANPNLACQGGLTPLFFATNGGHAHVVRCLIKAGAKLTSRQNGATPLAFAVYLSETNVIRALLELGATIPDDGFVVE